MTLICAHCGKLVKELCRDCYRCKDCAIDCPHHMEKKILDNPLGTTQNQEKKFG
jgi:hypothetical protein